VDHTGGVDVFQATLRKSAKFPLFCSADRHIPGFGRGSIG
jgi:hypothetical protein